MKYVGETETPNNSGFSNADFQKRMEAVGWIKQQSWCAYLAELIWKEAMPEYFKEFDKLFSGSATATYKNFDIAKWHVGLTPSLGAVVIWRYGNDWKGHAGIVIETNGSTFQTVEGNTNDKGGREGYIVARKIRLLNQPHKENGLNLVGFIHPPQPKSVG